MKYLKPEMDIVEFEDDVFTEDGLTPSIDAGNDPEETPWL